MNTKLTTNGKTVPVNLSVLLNLPPEKRGEWKRKNVYYLEAQDDDVPEGFFPARIKNQNPSQRRVVFSTDKKLMKDVWEKLPPCKSKIGSLQFYVNKEKTVGYRTSYKDKEDSLPVELLTRDEFVELINQEENVFEWLVKKVKNSVMA